ncbi:hypothetical protein JHK82_035910 [Glycine max]|uniref:Protein BIG GRAIN 1-like B n=1 Tax=Glycine max TaxID=3847 RepID=I1LY37_SOYBN|nr:protein BIG GRAIN 1-like B [Glycine max]KAG4970218.1 hypothetical protein JHK85_036639 [Glycine max]KAG4976625.1 hypothetical protein JHK86_036099 [Glycine max]KAG5112641.1 hypothetical protein JHK82_035910 [Glycine max]KAG5129919.1 hypothetical protein JHK84_036316 [Glycine max]KAH1100844.1 hypothetical protein GYH30_035801 [Glycine max]|eukprot:XP_003541297.2 protein BIG GRAIN 1-like B [Glycine max]
MHERSMKEAAGTCPQRRRTPSFSSSLLDAIYRSIDESKSNLHDDQQLGLHHHDQTTHSFTSEKGGKKERMNLRRAVMLEDWMEKHGSHSLNAQLLNSSSSSSECSSAGGIFSSSETDTTTTLTLKKQRPARLTSEKKKKKQDRIMSSEKQNKESGFTRTKLRALKIYGELNQRVKQPISPGSRIASFLSSIFNSQNVKKAKMCYAGAVEDVSFEHKSNSPCFSSIPSSFSRRSCMSKTPSSAKKSNNNEVKRSVRFYPVSVILGEDSEPQSSYHKCNIIYESEPNLGVRSSSIKELKKNTARGNENGAEEAAARGFVKGYRNSGQGEFDFRGFYDDDDEDDDDDVSCSSSDLFELDHLIGAARYQEELPVYETTNLETNKAIASGLCL